MRVTLFLDIICEKYHQPLLQSAFSRYTGTTYKQLEDDDSYFGEIPGFQGVWANELTLEACWLELAETLEDWLDLSLSRNLSVPDVEGIELIAE
jgi:predicted RNase H-like HicB family nuclease